MPPVYKAYDAKIDDVVEGERSVVAKITTDAIDRMGEVVMPAGADLKAYRANPVCLWAHNMDGAAPSIPVGRNLWIKPGADKRSLIAKTVFGTDDFSDRIFKLYQDGFLRAFSIGFQPDFTKSSPPTPAEVKARPDLAECRCIYRKWELLEYSAVPVPANPEALSVAVSKGLLIPESLEQALASLGIASEDLADIDDLDGLEGLEPAMPELPAFRTLAQVRAETEAQILARFDPAAIAAKTFEDLICRKSGRV